MRQKLTEKIAREAELPHERRSYYIWDTDVVGFGLHVTRSGARSFVTRYYISGRERKLTIGSYPDWSVIAARAQAKRTKREADLGRDPLGMREERRRAPTMADLAARYLEDHARHKVKRAYQDEKSMLRRLVLPKLGRLRVDEVKHGDVDALHRRISERTPYQANRTMALLRKMFNLAIRWEYRADNPVTSLQFNPEQPRHRYLSEDELARLTAVLADHPNRRGANVIRMLLLTGARKGEVLNATWDQFDLEKRIWTKPSAHTKQRREHRVPLSQATVALLESIRESRPPFCRFVFPGDRPGQAVTEIKTFWDSVRRKADLPDVRMHDLRHTYASILANSGLSLPIIGALLGHTQPQTTARYSHLSDNPLREATERVSAKIVEFPAPAPGQARDSR